MSQSELSSASSERQAAHYDEISQQEISALRYEQTERIKSRDSFVNYNIAALAIVLAASAASTGPGAPYLLLVVPWVCLSFGWTFVLNDMKIAQIAGFQALCRPAGGWEEFRLNSRTPWVASGNATVLVQACLFLLPGFVSIVVFSVSVNDIQWWTVVLLIVEVAFLAMLGTALLWGRRYRRQLLVQVKATAGGQD